MNGTARAGELPAALFGDRPPPFAMIRRHDPAGRRDVVDVFVGDLHTCERLADVPAGDATGDVLVLVPYRQLQERGLAASDDGAPLLALRVTDRTVIHTADLLGMLPARSPVLSDTHFAPDDQQYAQAVERVVADEIGRGEGANFVLKRSLRATVGDYDPRAALSLFGRLLRSERGAYWTFIVHTGSRTIVGASPERHVTLSAGEVTMNPISGTYRYPADGPHLDEIIDFLGDRKEIDELTMVVDEELKMMARICEPGITMDGPQLLEMAHLAHTGYVLRGRSDADPRTVLRETMFAPTVTGSPVESAARLIHRYESEGRGYYSGILALISEGDTEVTMDSAILIRTAEIDESGRMDIGLGATIVRHSKPTSEVAETHAKAAAIRAALEPLPPNLAEVEEVRDALARRNDALADFWLRPLMLDDASDLPLAGRRAVVVDAEDTFTAMLAHQLRSLGIEVAIQRHDEMVAVEDLDLVVMGPGPGDPTAADDPKIARLMDLTSSLLARRVPFLAVCLSHQVLSRRLGLGVDRLPAPNQGVQRSIDLFSASEDVGFYNSFSAWSEDDQVEHARYGRVLVSRDRDSGEVFALRGPTFASMQFHAESVLTREGPRIIHDQLTSLPLRPRPVRRAA